MGKKTKDVFKRENEEQILFFKVPLEFQMHMNSLAASEQITYIYFMTQVFYKHSLDLEVTYEDIMFYTGLTTRETVSRAIRGVAGKGWIGVIIYQKRAANIYRINLSPRVNEKLISKMESRRQKASVAKSSSIANGESGKFTK